MRRSRARRLARSGGHAIKEERWEAAATALQAAVDLDPRPARWHERLGYALARAGNHTGAVHAYQCAIAREPDHPMWHYRLGQALVRTRHWAAAARAFREADERARRRGLPPGGRLPSDRLSLERRIDLSIVPKPAYAYGIHRGAELARRLGVPRITAVEFGVAGGRGLLAMERHAATVEELTGVAVDVYGFDTGAGLPAPIDERDLPYRFAQANYAMDVDQLEVRLERAQLVLGDAAATFRDVLATTPAPIGMISFDMDLYSSTRAVLDSMGNGSDEACFLPRLTAYFDDVVGKRGQDYNEFTGELLAIREFNDANDAVKLAEDRRFRTLPLNAGWHHGVHTMHRFKHPDYTTYVSRSSPRSLRLRGPA